LYIYTHNSLRTKKNTKFDLKKNIWEFFER
jgi:hypothetical protein